MTKHFKTDSVIVRKFNMKDDEKVYLNLLQQNNYKNTHDEVSRNTDVNYGNKDNGKLKDKIIRNRNVKNNKSHNSNYQSMEETKLIVKSAINEYYTDEPTWAVEDKINKNLVGSIRVTNYSPKNKMCNVTWVMSYKYWDEVFMKDALTQIFKFLFTKKNIELIECSYYEQDIGASIILDKIGMTKEAVLRDRRVNEFTNEKENFVIYSINKQEFFEILNTQSVESRLYKSLKRKI